MPHSEPQELVINKEVNGHDFPAPSVPRAHPYGIYDLRYNRGFVVVGMDHATGAFAVASIWGWWRFEGHRLYRASKGVLMTADAGGSNGARLRLWKLELQKLAHDTGLSISVCHFPPGTSKWNIGCFRLSRPMGVVSHCVTTRRLLTGLREQQRRKGSR